MLQAERVTFLFFNKRTTYEIYQCDWSSDVCSSDLLLNFVKPALADHLANAGTAHSDAVDQNRFENRNAEIEILSPTREIFEVASSSLPKLEVFPDPQPGCVQAIDEDMAHEILRVDRCKRSIKMLHDHNIDAEPLEKLHLIFVSQEHFGRPLWREHHQRMWLKRQHDRAAAEPLGIADGPSNQRLMA